MITWFLRLFKEYRNLARDLEREAALNDSLERYIEALEGRDVERLSRIDELETEGRAAVAILRETIGAVMDLRTHLLRAGDFNKEEL
jgi:hypothetical protein